VSASLSARIAKMQGWCAERLTVPTSISNSPVVGCSLASYQEQLESHELPRLITELGTESQARKRIEELSKKMGGFQKKVCGIPSILFLGTARDRAVSPVIRRIISHTAELAVDSGIACTNGAACTGVMGEASRAWVRAWEGNFTRAKKAPLILVPLLFDCGTTEELFDPRMAIAKLQRKHWLNSDQRREVCLVSPKHSTIQTRTACGLLSMPRNLLHVFCPGGFGTLEELGTAFLAYQMRRYIQTPFSAHRQDCIPNYVFLDHRMEHWNSSGWFWDGLAIQVRNMLAIGAIDSENMPKIEVFRVGRREKEDLGCTKIRYFRSPREAALALKERAQATYLKQEVWFKATT
jgi:hypothetical protein